MMLPLTFNMSLTEKRRGRRLMYITALIVGVGAILFTFSRGAWIGVLCGLLLAGWLRGMNQFIKYFSVGIILLITVSVFIPKQLERFTGRAASITEINDKSTQSRLDQYKMSLEIMVKSPLLGTGVGQVPAYASKRGTPSLGEIHNLFLQIGAERGVPAMFAIIAVFFIYYRTISRRIFQTKSSYFRDMYITNVSVMVSFLVVNLTAYQLLRGLGIFLGIFLGMAAALLRIEEHMSDSGLLEEDLEYEDHLSREPTLLPGMQEKV